MACSLMNALLPSIVLVAASAAHHYSSTPPRIALMSSDHLLLSDEKRKESPENVKETLHDNRRLSQIAMLLVASTKVCLYNFSPKTRAL